MDLILFLDWLNVKADYVVRHIQNYTAIQSAINNLAAKVSGAMGSGLFQGLNEILDRRGIVGIASYDFDEGTLTGPNYYLRVAAGAYLNASLQFYSKATYTDLALSGESTGTKYVNIDASGNPTIATSADASTTRQFYWDASTHEVSSKALYTGVSILFDGDEYQDLLDSAWKGTSFDQAADRLEAIEQDLDPFAGFYGQDLPHSGLNFKYRAGKVRNDSAITDTTAGQVALTDDQTNYVEVDPSTGTVSANTTGFTSGKIPLYQVVTASGAITTVTDKRTAALVSGSGGGSHTQNTDTGTTSPTFTLNNDEAGTPSENCALEVERGTSANVRIRWNEATDKWEYTNDGTTYYELGEVDYSAILGEQEFDKLVHFDEPPKVHDETNRGTSSDWETLDLSSQIAAGDTGKTAWLRVFFYDDAPGAGINVVFRRPGSGASANDALTVWVYDSQKNTDLIPVEMDAAGQVEFLVTASGVDTADLQIYLVAYTAKIPGVGTAVKTMTKSGISVGAGSSQSLNYPGWLNRGECWYFKIDETGGVMTGTYGVEIYAKDTFLPGTDNEDLIYKAINIGVTLAFIDHLPFWVRDNDETSELHIKIINNDGSNGGTFTFTIKAEQFA
jgi:hypothetical protein